MTGQDSMFDLQLLCQAVCSVTGYTGVRDMVTAVFCDRLHMGQGCGNCCVFCDRLHMGQGCGNCCVL